MRIVAFVVLLSATARAEIPPGAFVRVDGTRFTVSGRPFAFVGANLEALQGERNRERHRETLHAVASDGLRVGRVWAFGEGPADASEWHRKHELFRAGPEGFLDEAERHLDRVLAVAREEGVRLIITLANHWPDYGGVPMYLRWVGLPDDDKAAFYRDPRTRALFRAHTLRLLARTNHVTGVRYVDDPTIFAWELMNESSVDTPDAILARRAWIVEMARLIKDGDPNHLVAAGLAGYTSRRERAEWIAVHQLPEIDYCDSHLYPQTNDRVTGWPDLADRIDDRAQLAHHVIGKPLVIGEFGFHTDEPGGDDSPKERAKARVGAQGAGKKTLPRAAWFGRLLDRLAFDGVAGALVWIYQPWSDRPRDFGIYVDRPHTDDVRRTLRLRAATASARAPRSKNARLGVSVGERLLYDPFVTLRGPPAPHRRWRIRENGTRVLEIPPGAFAEARFERAGCFDRSALGHVYGVGSGHFRYRFAAPLPPGRPPKRLVVRARLSSEWPGSSAPEGGGSKVEVRLDGVEVASLDAAPDDGAGTIHEIAVTDPALLRRLARGRHALTFTVPDRPDSHGLCIYGAATGTGEPPRGEAAPIQILFDPPEEHP
ncbi:MAG: hypothetical protein EXR72_22680 [Myxococcales bacterium]|nr:hypothetical protein [Myxococcales bacterium]